MKSKQAWKGLKGFDAWKPILDGLVADARAAAGSANSEDMLNVADYLNGFINASSPNAEVAALDAIASKFVGDLTNGVISDRLAAVTARTAEYQLLIKSLDLASDHAAETAKTLRLTRVQELVQAATQTVLAAKALSASLEDSTDKDDKALDAAIEAAVAAIQKLRAKVEEQG